jgi:hypothetical protein
MVAILTTHEASFLGIEFSKGFKRFWADIKVKQTLPFKVGVVFIFKFSGKIFVDVMMCMALRL